MYRGEVRTLVIVYGTSIVRIACLELFEGTLRAKRGLGSCLLRFILIVVI